MRPSSVSEALEGGLAVIGPWVVNSCPDALLLQECRKATSLLDLAGLEMPNRLHVAGGGRLDHMIRQKLGVERRDGPPRLVPGVQMPKLHAEDCGLERVEAPVESDLD